jgi:hypothetical protein
MLAMARFSPMGKPWRNLLDSGNRFWHIYYLLWFIKKLLPVAYVFIYRGRF